MREPIVSFRGRITTRATTCVHTTRPAQERTSRAYPGAPCRILASSSISSHVISTRTGQISQSPTRFRGGVNNWILQSYLRLRPSLAAAGVATSIGESLRDDSVNIAHRDTLNRAFVDYGRYCIVGVRADRPPLRVCDWEIVQNRLARPADGRFYIPFWPQPGLRPRAAARGDRVERIGYFGRTSSAPAWFFDPTFHRRLSAIGVDFRVCDKAWHDYSDVDVAISFRIEAPAMLRQKPASKLVNAWLAGVPFLANREPAFESLRRGELDYGVIEGPNDLLAWLALLRCDPWRYRRMAANGNLRAREFTVESTRKAWLELLLNDVVPAIRLRRDKPVARRPLPVARLLWQKAESRWFKFCVACELRQLRHGTASRVREMDTPRQPAPLPVAAR